MLAFGDSLTFGSGVEKLYNYPAILGKLSQLEVINAGIPGEETDAGLQRLPELLDRYRPELVIITHGGNDFLRRRERASTRQHLASMLSLVDEYGSQAVLIAVPEPGIFLDAAPLYAELAQEHGVPLEADILSQLLADRSMKSDQIHFNEAGYRRMALAIHQLLLDSGALAQSN